MKHSITIPKYRALKPGALGSILRDVLETLPMYIVGSLMGSPGFEPGTSASSRLPKIKDLVEEYLEYRFSRVNSEKSKWWIQKTINELMKHTRGNLSREKLMKFQNWYKTNYEYEAQCKFHDNTRNFLEWLYKRTGNEEFRKLKEVLERPQKASKKINFIVLREPDVHNLVKAVWNSTFTPYLKLKLIAGILFAAYTGQRPDATTGKLTFEEFEEALKRDPPMLWVPENKDKESFPHWVPLHPVVVEWIRPVIELRHIGQSKHIFPYDLVRKAFDELNIKAVHTSRKITYSHLRKFFEQMCNNILMVHPGLRDYIMAHNTGSLDVQSYDGKLPSEIYEQYMAAWKDVNLVPEEVRLEDLLNHIRKTVDLIP